MTYLYSTFIVGFCIFMGFVDKNKNTEYHQTYLLKSNLTPGSKEACVAPAHTPNSDLTGSWSTLVHCCSKLNSFHKRQKKIHFKHKKTLQVMVMHVKRYAVGVNICIDKI